MSEVTSFLSCKTTGDEKGIFPLKKYFWRKPPKQDTVININRKISTRKLSFSDHHHKNEPDPGS